MRLLAVALSLGRFKPEPLPVEPSGYPGHKTIYPPCLVLVIVKEQQKCVVFL